MASTTCELAPSPSQERASPRHYVLAAALLAGAVLALAADLPVARLCQPSEGVLPVHLRKLLSLSEIFSHGLGVALLAAVWFALDGARRWSLPRLVACAYGSGILADVVKLIVGRTRPNSFDLSSGVAESFLGWLPIASGDDLALALNRSIQSFPSAHSAMAAGLAVVLASFYPHARWLFVMLAALAMLQRVESGAHFVSDVFAGAALGCLWAGICLDRRLLGRWFDRLESNKPEAQARGA